LKSGNSVFYELNSSPNEYVYEDHICLIIIKGNISFIKEIVDNKPSISTLEDAKNKLVNGFAVYVDKDNSDIIIYTDVFNFYHLFYYESKETFYISTEFRLLSQLIPSTSIDELAILDMFLFNYCLLNRTTQKNIKRFYGGSKINVSQKKIKEDNVFNFANNYQPKIRNNFSRIKVNSYISIFKSICKNEVNDSVPTCLSITGGIDSRMILAACSSLDLNFSTFTFGQSGNIESETAHSFIDKYSNHHNFIELDDVYIKGIEKNIKSIIKDSLDNPTILDLAHYDLVKEQYKNQNIFFGFMGGELLLGQSDGAQVTFTHFAKILLTCESQQELKQTLIQYLKSKSVFSNEFISKNIDEYLDSLKIYLKKGDNSNILKFLLNEKYSKFFGTINKIISKNNNVIVPFVHPEIIDQYLSANLSFLNKTPFVKRPYLNMKGKFFQGKVIKKLEPSLGKTRFDRRYTVNDLAIPFLRVKTISGYVQNHFLKANKKNYPRPHDCDNWYQFFVTNQLSSENTRSLDSIFDLSFRIDQNNYSHFTANQKKKMANLAAVICANNYVHN